MNFLDDNFILKTETAQELFHNYAEELPIIDYHCHLNPKEIAENKKFKNITEAWLSGDHYKWRLMRIYGIDESLITGNAPDYDKFKAFSKVIGGAIGNPLYHWSHLELNRYFNIDIPLSEKTADEIWEKANKVCLEMTPKDLILKSNVKVICTTDDPIDNLEYHRQIRESGFACTVIPTFRPDRALATDRSDFVEYIGLLSKAATVEINNIDTLLFALQRRVSYFAEMDCKLSDHAFDRFPYEFATKDEADTIFKKRLNNEIISPVEDDKFKTYMLLEIAEMLHKSKFTMQLHMGAMRNNNTNMFIKLGRDIGFDIMSDYNVAYSLSRFLDALDAQGVLPKTILYTLNPKDNYILAAMAGTFSESGVKGKIQFGSAWWFLDHKEGMELQMRNLASLGHLSTFIGMLTDSRSFLSYTRHEYFRRIMCNLIGEFVENGEFPNDMEMLGKIVSDISYYNAKNYFGFKG